MGEFQVREQELWSRLVDWSANAVENHALLGPLNNSLLEDAVAKCAKHSGMEHAGRKHLNQAAVLQALAKYLRLAVMDKEFFCDKVRPFLQKEQCDSIMMYHMLGRLPAQQITTKRSGVRPVEEEIVLTTVSAEHLPDEAAKLPMGSASWTIGSTPSLQVISVTLPFKAVVSKVRFIFDAEGTLWPGCTIKTITLPARPFGGLRRESDISSDFNKNGRMATLDVLPHSPVDRFSISVNQVTDFRSVAALKQLQVSGKKPLDASAADVAHRLSTEFQLG